MTASCQYMNESCHAYILVTWHMGICNITHQNHFSHTNTYVMSHTSKACLTYEWVISRVELSHIMPYTWVMALMIEHDSIVRVIWTISDTIHVYVMCMTCTWVMALMIEYDSIVRVIWTIIDMTHVYVMCMTCTWVMSRMIHITRTIESYSFISESC